MKIKDRKLPLEITGRPKETYQWCSESETKFTDFKISH